MAEEHDVATELSGLRKEVLEMRNLVIKTDNLLKTFHTELKDVAKKHALSERRHQLGHVGGYAVIGVVALAGALLYGSAAGSGARAEATTRLDDARRKETEAQSLLAQAQQRASAQEQVTGEAMTVWQLLGSSDAAKQDEGLARAARLDRNKLTAFTRDAIDRTAQSLRRTRAEDTLAAAFGDGKPSDPHQAAAAFERFLGVAEQMPATWHAGERLQAAYQLGALYNGLGEHDKAVPFLKKAVAGNLPASNRAYAYLLLGDSLDRTSHHAEAEEAFKAGLKLGPSGLTSSLLKKRLGPDAPT